MEGNKEEAIRAKRIAEKKLAGKDYVGAKRFAMKAQRLYPQLNGLSQTLKTIDVFISSENKINGHVDLYGILGVDPSVDAEALRKHYLKLALMIHPDKNHCQGAYGAFQWAATAWGMLADRAKRAAYDQVLNSMGSGQRVGQDTFWTLCHGCMILYEYLRIYVNQVLLCKTCNVGFRAIERSRPIVAPPPNQASATPQATSQRMPNSSEGDSSQHCSRPVTRASRRASLSSTFDGNNEGQSSRPAKRSRKGTPRSLTQLRNKKLRRDGASTSHTGSPVTQPNVGTSNASSEPVGGSLGQPNGEASVDRARSSISEVLEKTRLRTRIKREEGEREIDRSNVMRNGEPSDMTEEVPDVKKTDPMAVDVPDSDFHNFDLARSEESFEEGQVWAAYDDDDRMPRFYALIKKVISLKPLEMDISCLNPRNNHDLGPIDFVGFGFSKACGDFRPGKIESADVINSFSHKVQFSKGKRGILRIFPTKGDVWALYRKWSPKWNKRTSKKTRQQYDMVEVLEGYSEKERSVSVVLLVKVAGFKAVFCRSKDPSHMRKIPKDEMFRFSHQVPNHVLPGQEACDASMQWQELDPAALSSEFLTLRKMPEGMAIAI